MTTLSADPGNAPAWYVDIETIAWRSEPPLRAHPQRRKAVLERPKPVGRGRTVRDAGAPREDPTVVAPGEADGSEIPVGRHP